MVLQLAALEGDDAARQRHRHSLVHVAGSVETVGMAVSAVVTAVARTIFAFDSRVSIHRTGMFLLMYLVVHMVSPNDSTAPAWGSFTGDNFVGFSAPATHLIIIIVTMRCFPVG